MYLGKDKVESAKCRIEEFNKDIQIKTFKTRLNAENYKNIVDGYNFIVDCFDSFESKFLLNDIALDMKIPLVHGGVTGFCGQVMTIIPKESACLRCILPQDEQEYMVKGIVSPTVSTIASIESMEVCIFSFIFFHAGAVRLCGERRAIARESSGEYTGIGRT